MSLEASTFVVYLALALFAHYDITIIYLIVRNFLIIGYIDKSY